MLETYEVLEGECGLCDRKAEILYIYSGFLGLKIRKFCKRCAKLHQRAKQD